MKEKFEEPQVDELRNEEGKKESDGLVELLKKENPDLCADPAKLEEKFNEFEKKIQELEDKDDAESKAARNILLQGRNTLARLLDKEIIEE